MPFERINVWYTIKVQTKSLVEPGRVTKPTTMCAEPPGSKMEQSTGASTVTRVWDLGRADCALFINDITSEFAGKANLKGRFSSFPAYVTNIMLRSLCRPNTSHFPTYFSHHYRYPTLPRICAALRSSLSFGSRRSRIGTFQASA